MKRHPHRSNSGAVLPLIVVATLLLVAFLAYSVDVSRSIFAVQKLQFAAEAAALDAYAQLVFPAGQIPTDRGAANAQTAVQRSHGNMPWNDAPLGPLNQSGPFNGGVTIGSDDVNLGTHNPGDATEPVLQVTARRTGSEALRFFFLPAIFSMNARNGDGGVPADAQTASPYRTVEVIGAPATRIGKGARRDLSTLSNFSGWAVFPLGLSYQQFVNASNPATGTTTYLVDLLDSRTPYPAVQPNRIRGAFVNVIHQGGPAMEELIGSCRYFGSSINANEMPPDVAERGSQLTVFDSGAAAFQNRLADVKTALQGVPVGRHYIVPILKADPAPGAVADIEGFALLRLVQLVNPATGQLSPTFAIGDSYPVRNATSSPIRTIPSLTAGNPIRPATTGPFAARIFNPQTNSLSPRYRGVALAPVTSPRSI